MSKVRFETWLVRPVRECGLDFLNADEAERAARFARQEDRDTFVSARTALRCLLVDDAKVHPGALRLTANAWGRPALDPPSPDFNVSHTEGLVVIALAHGARIGVDVERVRAVPDRARIAADVFEPDVVRWLADVPGQQRDAVFLRLWTAGEAWVKATGIGLGGGGMPVPLAVSPDGSPVLRPEHRDGWTLVPLTLPTGYVGALALESKLPPGTRCTPRPLNLDARLGR
jgi:4'-phosphopantetheinyl transferase